MNIADLLASLPPPKPKPPAKRKPNSHDAVIAFRNKYVFGRKPVITPDDLRTALQAIHDAFDQRELFGGAPVPAGFTVSPLTYASASAALNSISAEGLHIPLQWDAATGKLRALDPKEDDRGRYRGFAVKDGRGTRPSAPEFRSAAFADRDLIEELRANEDEVARYVLPPEVRKLADAIAAKQQAYRRGLAAERGLPMESIPYRILVTLGTLSAKEAVRLGFGEYPDFGDGHLQYDASEADWKWTKPLQIEGQAWIQPDSAGNNRGRPAILQRVVPRDQWSGRVFTKDEVADIRSLGLPADKQRWRVKKQLDPKAYSDSLLLPGQRLTAGGKPYVATNEVRTFIRSPFADNYYLGEWYEAQDGTVFGVVGFVAPSGDEPTRKIGYGKGAKKIAVDRVYVIFADDPTTAVLRPVARGDRRIRDMKELRFGMAQSQKKWDGLPVVSPQSLKQLQSKTAGLLVFRSGE